MSTTNDEWGERLARARARMDAQDARGVIALLGDVDRVDLVGEPELGFLLATALRRIGDGDRAFALVTSIAAACERRGRDALWRRRLNLEAALHLERGRAADAESAWIRLVEAALVAADHETLSRAHINLGIVCTLHGRWEEALANYGRALAACHRSGDRRGLAQAHQNIAISYREMGFQREADAHFTSALELALTQSHDDIAGRVEEERALNFLLAGDEPLAEATCARALARLERIGDRAGAGEALRVLGLCALAAGRIDHARHHFLSALDAATETRGALLEAETREALAAVERRSDNDELALDHASRAAQIFATIGAAGWGARERERVTSLALRREPPAS